MNVFDWIQFVGFVAFITTAVVIGLAMAWQQFNDSDNKRAEARRMLWIMLRTTLILVGVVGAFFAVAYFAVNM